ncbi:hypothetical protein JCM11491_006049 [Sporobolomyces phaffii]
MSPSSNTPAEPPTKRPRTTGKPQDHAHKQDKNFTKDEDGNLDDFPHLLPYENKDPDFEVKYKAHCHCGVSSNVTSTPTDRYRQASI